MNLQQLKQLKKRAKEVYVENNISGSAILSSEFDTTEQTSRKELGFKSEPKEPWTERRIWSHWRIGFKISYRGRYVIVWYIGYYPSLFEDGSEIFWGQDGVWDIGKGPLRTDATSNLFWDLFKESRERLEDVSMLTLTNARKGVKGMPKVSAHGQLREQWPDWVVDYSGYRFTIAKRGAKYWLWGGGDYGTQTMLYPADSIRDAKWWIKVRSVENAEKLNNDFKFFRCDKPTVHIPIRK